MQYLEKSRIVNIASRDVVIGAKTLVSIIPILIAAFLVTGFVNVLISKAAVTKWLGAEAGWKGPFLPPSWQH